MSKRKKDYGAISFSLNGGAEIKLSGQEFDDLVKRVNSRKSKQGPVTKPQADTLNLFRDFVRGSLKP